MDNDRIFTIYALTLIAGVTSVITASVLAGVATLPSAGVFLEHVAMSIAFRGAYKSFGGFEWLQTAGAFFGFITLDDLRPQPDMVHAEA
jgi:hypothetical protein